MKQRLCIIGIVLLAASFAGCGKASTEQGNGDSNQPTVVTPLPTEEAVETKVPEPTAMMLPTCTSTPSPTPTPTRIPPDLSKSEKIPVISVETENEQNILSRDEYVKCKISVYNVSEEYSFTDVSAGIRVRGNSSAYYGDVQSLLTKEVPYRIKFDKKTNLLGLNQGAECKSWVLLRCDEGLMREEAAMAMGRAILGENYYCSDAEFVHLYLNGEFKWLALLCEQSQVNKYRVDVTEPEENYTGTDIGYFLEIDNYADEDEHPYFRMNYEYASVTDFYGETQEFSWANYSIKSDIYSEEQKKFITKYTRNVFSVVYDACVNGIYWKMDENNNLTLESDYDNAKDTIAAVMDLDSVVRMYILDEIVHDYDCGEGSFYMCVDFAKDSKYPKMTFVCPWDFEWTYRGNAQGKYYAGVFNPDKEWLSLYGDRSNPWYVLLMTQDWFLEMVKERWAELHEEQVLEKILAEERSYMQEYKADLNRKKAIATDTGEVILSWIEKRIAWLDKMWLGN